jgi:starvation-inducible DNA-binding protein
MVPFEYQLISPSVTESMSVIISTEIKTAGAAMRRKSSGSSLTDTSETGDQSMKARETQQQSPAVASMPAGFELDAVAKISTTLTALLADMFALYVKTKNFHWHVSGPHFRDYHRLLDEQSEEILGTTDDIAERVRKLGGMTLRSVGQIARLQRVLDNDKEFVSAQSMLAELRVDNAQMTLRLRGAHSLCDDYGDVASASLIENWIDEAERRVWFLYEATRRDAEG